MPINQFLFNNNLFWTQNAQIQLNTIPFFIRIQARQRIEELAHLAKLEEVTVDIVEKVSSEFSH